MANYHIHVDGQPTGPFTEEQLCEQHVAGQINDETLVWVEDSPDWVAFKELKLEKPKIQLRRSDPAAVQFERAEFTQPANAVVTCTGCKVPIPDLYYVVNGEIACGRCSGGLQASLTGGSGMTRFLRALGAGVAAAIVSGGVWYAVLKFLEMQLGLLAIGVGLLVGFAVRWGAQGRGGWKYQLLAMALTYGAIVSTYVPFLVEGFRKEAREHRESAADTNVVLATESEVAAAPSAPAETAKPKRSVGKLMLGYTFLFIVALAMPFLMGFSNIIGLIIIGIALYEAWKINKRVPVTIEGPFHVGAPRPAA